MCWHGRFIALASNCATVWKQHGHLLFGSVLFAHLKSMHIFILLSILVQLLNSVRSLDGLRIVTIECTYRLRCPILNLRNSTIVRKLISLPCHTLMWWHIVASPWTVSNTECFSRLSLIWYIASIVTTSLVVTVDSIMLLVELFLLFLLLLFNLVFQLKNFGKFKFLPRTDIHLYSLYSK